MLAFIHSEGDERLIIMSAIETGYKHRATMYNVGTTATTVVKPVILQVLGKKVFSEYVGISLFRVLSRKKDQKTHKLPPHFSPRIKFRDGWSLVNLDS